jgi:hypothetical protein
LLLTLSVLAAIASRFFAVTFHVPTLGRKSAAAFVATPYKD